MSNRVSRIVVSLVIALTMAFGSLMPHATHSQPHVPNALSAAMADRHAQFEAEIAEHGHSHHDEKEHERVADHSHSHNPADHSHETPTTPPDSAPVLSALMRTWVPMPPHTAHLGASHRLERPPRPIVTA